jgi:fatty-acyl-CoA synthase
MLFHARTHPKREALISSQGRLSYEDLSQQVNRLARALRSLGVSSGDRVALMLPNCPEYVIAQEAMPRIGALAVQIGYQLKSEELAHILADSEPHILIYHIDCEEEVKRALPCNHSLQLVVVDSGSKPTMGAHLETLLAKESPELLSQRADEAGGVIVYTSGTTGKAKGASRKWRDFDIRSVIDFARQTGMRSDERHLVVSPLYHSAAMGFAKIMTALGATLILHKRFVAEEVLATIERESITSMFVVPTMLVRINALDVEVKRRYDTSSLRWVMSGAAPLSQETAQRFQDEFGEILYNFYGATETGTVTLALPADHGERPGTIGRVLRGNEILILNEDGEPVAPGEVGELYVRNGMLIGGYHNNPQATRASLQQGYFSVGDLARMDEQGYLYLASRKTDMVISGGVNVYPREIEDVLHRHPEILEATVVGVPDAEWGESLRAYVVRESLSALDEDEVLAHCRAILAKFKVPRSVIFVEELPRTATGKILKRALASVGEA